MSLLLSTTTALEAATVPAVTPSIVSSSASLMSAEPITKLPAVTAPVAVRLRKEAASLLESTTTALEAATVPAVIPSSISSSASVRAALPIVKEVVASNVPKNLADLSAAISNAGSAPSAPAPSSITNLSLSPSSTPMDQTVVPSSCNSTRQSPSPAVLLSLRLVPFAWAPAIVKPVSAVCVRLMSLSAPKLTIQPSDKRSRSSPTTALFATLKPPSV